MTAWYEDELIPMPTFTAEEIDGWIAVETKRARAEMPVWGGAFVFGYMCGLTAIKTRMDDTIRKRNAGKR